MSEGALDLSLSSYDSTGQRAGRAHDQGSSDSGRASSDSTASDIHDDVKHRLMTSPHIATPSGHPVNASMAGAPVHQVTPGLAGLPPTDYPPAAHVRDMPSLPSVPSVSNVPNVPSVPSVPTHSHHPLGVSSSSSPPRMGLATSGSLSSPNSPEPAASSILQGEEDFKPVIPPITSVSGSSSLERTPDSRVAPIRPFKMYPVDPFNVYSSQLMSGSSGGLSPSPVGMQSIYDSGSPSAFPSFPLTPLTSHLLQRKRRMENRDGNGGNGSAPSASPGNSAVNSAAASNSGQTAVSTSNLATSSAGKSDSSNGCDSDPEKKMKLAPDEKKDEAYWDRRRKNNEAAKRSRDARRQKEEEIAMRAAFLEQENLKLRAQVAILKNETAKLHYMLYNRI